MKIAYFIIPLILMPIVGVAVVGFNSSGIGDLKPIGRVTAFNLVDQKERPVSLETFHKKIWIASFLFTRCSEQCPRLAAKLTMLQSRPRLMSMREHLRFASFSVDPGYDTPEKLDKFASRYNADPDHWYFLTGEAAELEKTIKSFRVSGGPYDATDPALMSHSAHFILVDGFGNIYGYYDSESETALNKLEKDARRLRSGLY